MRSTSQPPNLVAQAQSESLESLFVAHRPRLWKLIYYRMHGSVKRRLDPDDILQDVYLAARQRFDRFQGSQYPSAFLWLRDVALQTLHNTHRFHLSTQQRDVLREETAANSDSRFSTHWGKLIVSLTSPSKLFMKAETLSMIRECLGSLSEKDQEVLSMRHFEELTNAEVAAVLNIEPKAASMRYMRALDRLRTMVAPFAGPDF